MRHYLILIGIVAPLAARAYTLPDLPAMPAIPATQTANSIPMGDPANFAETNMTFAIETNGPVQPTWTSIAGNVPGNGTPAWLRMAKFGIWFHYGPQAALASGDWSAQHMYQQGATAYNNHLAQYGHPTTNGYKDVLHTWNPTNYNPTALAQVFHDAGARFVLVQGVHHDNFDNWNSRYNPWNAVNFDSARDTMAEWTNACHSLGMRMGVAFHHEYSWWFYQPAFLRDTSGALANVPYDAVTATNSAGQWWAGYDTRRLYNIDLHEYQGIATPTTDYWNPTQGIFTNHLDYAHWYATQWALRMLDVIENYDPDFIYTDGNSTQPFSGYATGTGYKCDAMQRVIAHLYNRALQRHGQPDTLAVVKFHSGDRVGTTFEGNYPSAIKTDQPWFAEMAIGDWFWKPGISYDSGGTIVQRLLEAISRDGAMMVNIPNKPDGSLDTGATNMLAGVGQWMAIHGEGIYGSRAWVRPTEGSFRFTVGTNGFLYAYYMGIPSAGAKLTIASLATSSNLLAGAVGSVSLLGSGSALVWSQTSTGLAITCPTPMPSLPSGTAIGFKIGPPSSVGVAIPANVIAVPGTNQIAVSWYCPSATATYNVKRATTQGGTYTTIASNLTGFAYSDTAVAANTLYFYVVSAVDAAGESANSAETSACLTSPPGSVWLTQDIGSVGATGSFSAASGVFTIQGSGADIWDSADEFRYVFQALTGDCDITARVLSMQNTAPWAKAGVMIRETLDPASKYAINFMSPSHGVALQQRASTGGSASGVNNPTGLTAPYWVRLLRTGDLFAAFYSADGTNWTAMGSTTITMNSTVYAGLAVCSVNDGTLCEAQFDNVAVTLGNNPVPPATPTGLAAAPGNNQVALSWNAVGNATSYSLKRSGAGTIASGAITNWTDFFVVNEQPYYYTVAAANVAGVSADSAPIVAVPMAPVANLWAYWRFDEIAGTSAFDSSLNGRAALLTGGASWAAGKINNAASLNGSTGYVSCPNNLLNGVTNFTIAAWVNPATDSTWARVFDFGSNTTTNMFLTPRNGVTGGIRFAITTGSFGSEQQLTGSSALPAATWSHVAVTLSNTTGILYVNGVGVATNTSMTLTPSSLGNTTQNWLGRSHYNDPYFYGRIDDFRIYDRPLSATEVQSLTNLPGLTAFQLWQYQYFGSTNCSTCAGNSDYDGDGMSNFDEFLAGTSPTNSASAFQILSIVPVSNDIVITWQSVAGKTNAVEANSADISGPMFITGSQTNYTDPSALTNTPSRLYRIRLVP